MRPALSRTLPYSALSDAEEKFVRWCAFRTAAGVSGFDWTAASRLVVRHQPNLGWPRAPYDDYEEDDGIDEDLMVFGSATGTDSMRRTAQRLHASYKKNAVTGKLLELDEDYTPFDLIKSTQKDLEVLCVGVPPNIPSTFTNARNPSPSPSMRQHCNSGVSRSNPTAFTSPRSRSPLPTRTKKTPTPQELYTMSADDYSSYQQNAPIASETTLVLNETNCSGVICVKQADVMVSTGGGDRGRLVTRFVVLHPISDASMFDPVNQVAIKAELTEGGDGVVLTLPVPGSQMSVVLAKDLAKKASNKVGAADQNQLYRIILHASNSHPDSVVKKATTYHKIGGVNVSQVDTPFIKRVYFFPEGTYGTNKFFNEDVSKNELAVKMIYLSNVPKADDIANEFSAQFNQQCDASVSAAAGGHAPTVVKRVGREAFERFWKNEVFFKFPRGCCYAMVEVAIEEETEKGFGSTPAKPTADLSGLESEMANLGM